jgi:cytochrome c-type biogenesis protein CcmH
VARYYLALADGQAGDLQKAIDGWQALAADIPQDSPMREAIARHVAEAAAAGHTPIPPLPPGMPSVDAPQDQAAAEAAPGPSGEQMAAAGAMPAAARDEMIRAMVAQLASRLHNQPDDVDGWLRLGRAYAVLGESDQAADALQRAVGLRPNDAAIALQAFQAMVSSLSADAALPPTAVTLLRTIDRLAPDQPEALWYLGSDALRNARADDARRYWTKLLGELPPGSAEAARVKEALGSLPR